MSPLLILSFVTRYSIQYRVWNCIWNQFLNRLRIHRPFLSKTQHNNTVFHHTITWWVSLPTSDLRCGRTYTRVDTGKWRVIRVAPYSPTWSPVKDFLSDLLNYPFFRLEEYIELKGTVTKYLCLYGWTTERESMRLNLLFTSINSEN